MKTYSEFIKEIMNESSWSHLVYHATYNKDFDPQKIRPGTHFGTLHAAMDRARDIEGMPSSEEPDSPPNKREDLKVHAFKFAPGKSIKVGDNTPLYGDYDELKKNKVIKPHPHDQGGNDGMDNVDSNDLANHMQKQLKSKGVSHLTYDNGLEGVGSTSHIVYDTSRLKHVHSFDAPNFVDRKRY